MRCTVASRFSRWWPSLPRRSCIASFTSSIWLPTTNSARIHRLDMLPLDRKILDALARADYKPVTDLVLAKQLNVTKKKMSEFRAALERLLSTGAIRQTANQLLRPRAAAGLVQGTIKKTASGAGFLIPHKATPGLAPAPASDPRANDVFIAPHELGDAQTGDEVLLQLHRPDQKRGGKLRGRVVEILQRSTRTFVGAYFERDAQGFVQVDGTTV